MTLLGSQTEKLEKMATLCEHEKNAIIDTDHERLDETNGAKLQLVRHLDRIEKERIHLFAQVCSEKKLPQKEATVSDLVAALDEPEASHLRLSAQRLKSIAFQIKRLNAVNKELIRHSQNMVSASLSLFMTGNRDQGVYRSSGIMHNEESEGMILSGSV